MLIIVGSVTDIRIEYVSVVDSRVPKTVPISPKVIFQSPGISLEIYSGLSACIGNIKHVKWNELDEKGSFEADSLVCPP